MTMEHVMIDLETLDTTDSSYILSIGAVLFDPDAGIVDGGHFYTAVQGEQPGRTMSRSTVQWWMNDPRVSSAARTVFTDQTAKQLRAVLEGLLSWLRVGNASGHHLAPLFYWANDPDFDVSILKHACAQHSLVWPGRYNSGRSFRTITHRAFGYDSDGRANVKAWPARNPNLVEHHALHDAIYEAQVVCAAWKAAGR